MGGSSDSVRPYKWPVIGALALLLGMVGADLLIPRLTQQIIDQGIAAGDLGVIAGTALAMIGAAIILGYMFSVSRIHLVSLHPFLPLPLGEGIGRGTWTRSSPRKSVIHCS